MLPILSFLPFFLSRIESDEDRTKFLYLLEQHENFIHNFALFLMHYNVDNANDVEQDVYLQLIHQISSIRIEDASETKHLVSRIVKVKAMMFFRKRKREVLIDDEDIFDDRPSLFSIPEEFTLQKIGYEELIEQIYRLKPLYQCVFIEKYKYGRTHQEIAKIYHISEDYSKQLFARAKEKLKKYLKVNKNEPS